jgi:ABC-2 type transport system permease protein
VLDEGRVVETGTPDELKARLQGDSLRIRVADTQDVALGAEVLAAWVRSPRSIGNKGPESVHDAGFVWVIPLTFASSAIVPIGSMPTVVRWLADINPMTSVVDATRALMLGQPAGSAVIRSVLWIAALLAVFVPLAVRAYQRR